MGLFSKKEKKTEVKSSLNEEKELNLFADDIHSEAFLEKARELNDVNKKFQKGYNLLHFACEYHNMELARVLLERNIRIDETNIYGNTPLWTAVFNARGNYEMVELLMTHQANPNTVNKADTTPLKLAESFGDEALVRILNPTQ